MSSVELGSTGEGRWADEEWMNKGCEVAVEDQCTLPKFKLILGISYEVVFRIIFFSPKRQVQCKKELNKVTTTRISERVSG